MDELKVFERDGVDVVDSRDVAALLGKRHDNLVRDISRYIEILGKYNHLKFEGDENRGKNSTESKLGFSRNHRTKSTERNFALNENQDTKSNHPKFGDVNESNFGLVDFFIPSTYKDGKGETRPCYLLTKKGCDMVANKMTGEKGVLFTAAYVTAFEKMRDTITNGALIAPKDYPSALRALADAEEKRMALQAKNEQQAQMIGELKPKADYTDRILKSKGVVPITAIAKDYGMSGNEMNKLLHSLGVQYRMGDMWLLYRCYHGKGYTHSETFDFKHQDGTQDARMTTKWTQKGRLFLYDLLKEHGVLPVIEREDFDKAQ